MPSCKTVNRIHTATHRPPIFTESFCRLIGLLILSGLIHGCAQKNTVLVNPAGQSDGSGTIADAVPKYEPTSKRGNPSSYVVWGKRYYVMKQHNGFSEHGIASWYGKKFHGRKTSSGEIYNMYAMTAAHKTLPLPAYVKVKNLQNGREITVRVNDRGPFHPGRVIDLSFAAAKKLGILRNGTARVEIQDVSITQQQAPVASTQPEQMHAAAAADDNLYIQIGAFTERNNADRLSSDIEHPNLPAIRVKADHSTRPVFRVQLGPLQSLTEAEKVMEHLNKQGITSSRLVFESIESAAPVIQ